MESPTVHEYHQMAVNDVLRCFYFLHILLEQKPERNIITAPVAVLRLCHILVFLGSIVRMVFIRKIE